MGTSRRAIGFKSGTATAQSGTSEIVITGLPDRIALIRVMVRRVSGYGATAQPAIGAATAPDSTGLSSRIYRAAATAAHVIADNLFTVAELTDGTLYLRPTCVSGTNNVIDWKIAFEAL